MYVSKPLLIIISCCETYTSNTYDVNSCVTNGITWPQYNIGFVCCSPRICFQCFWTGEFGFWQWFGCSATSVTDPTRQFPHISGPTHWPTGEQLCASHNKASSKNQQKETPICEKATIVGRSLLSIKVLYHFNWWAHAWDPLDLLYGANLRIGRKAVAWLHRLNYVSSFLLFPLSDSLLHMPGEYKWNIKFKYCMCYEHYFDLLFIYFVLFYSNNNVTLKTRSMHGICVAVRMRTIPIPTLLLCCQFKLKLCMKPYIFKMAEGFLVSDNTFPFSFVFL